jgi:hypothetical protein
MGAGGAGASRDGKTARRAGGSGRAILFRRIREKRPRHLRPPRRRWREWLVVLVASACALAMLCAILSFL